MGYNIDRTSGLTLIRLPRSDLMATVLHRYCATFTSGAHVLSQLRCYATSELTWYGIAQTVHMLLCAHANDLGLRGDGRRIYVAHGEEMIRLMFPESALTDESPVIVEYRRFPL